MMEFFDFKRQNVLPPAGIPTGFPICKSRGKIKKRAVYCGGLTKVYGGDIMLEAFDMLNKNRFPISLCVICREDDKQNIGEYINLDWLEIKHLSGNELDEVYKSSDFALIPMKRDKYMDFTVPVKLFNYLSSGLPLVTTDCPELKGYVEKYNVGVVCEDNAHSISEGIKKLYDNIDTYRENIPKAVEKNTWDVRAKKVVDDLNTLN